jgi:NAD(P)H dehydrogenase (quinone)
MATVRLAIIYYSTYGTNFKMAQIAEDAAEAAGAEVRLVRVPETAPEQVVQSQEAWRKTLETMRHVPEVTHDDMEWANAYLFSAPTRYGVSASQLRAFIDTLGPLWQKGSLANKAVSGMTSAMNAHGGQETTLISLYTTMMHWGSIIVAPGYTDPIQFKAGGNPYGVTVTANGGPIPDEQKQAIEFQARRLVEIAAKLAGDDAVTNGTERRPSEALSRAR